MTVEPTVGWWDTGEYILTSSKLEVGHPPGAPLFQMLGAFFSIFASEPAKIGYVLNMMSATSSAFTILFMFWSIVLILKKIISQKSILNDNSKIAVLCSAFTGSLAFAFTDSFWFNAVETEVYAMATLIMSLMFYLGLRWQNEMHTPKGNRWLILISFIVGLSFGVHFMGLLTIPAIGLLYFFENYKTITIKNFIAANVIVTGILLFVFKLLAPNILRYFSILEIFFVNTIGLPFNSGSVIALILLVYLIYLGLKYTKEKGYVNLNTGLMCLTFVIIGFTSWLMLPIRANENVPVNENNPSSARELLAYYNLEQYPETKLFYGPQFTDFLSDEDKEEPYVDDKPKYEKDLKSGKYVIVNDYKDAKQNYNKDHASFLPRMWSPDHTENYLSYTNGLKYKIRDFKYFYDNYNDPEKTYESVKKSINESEERGYETLEDYINFFKEFGQRGYIDIEKPSLLDNIYYMFDYQLGYMYWRYFMWNFSGRQDDIQGKNNNHGNWITGINPLDSHLLDITQENLPSDVKNNKARNTYFLLPLLLGLIGVVFVFKTNKKMFWTMLVFFLFTGIAIQVYTNVRPYEPRERDYSIVGSFYVFALWIGVGVYAIYDWLKKYMQSKFLAPAIGLLCLITVPGILISQNWDDHDRSGRSTAHAAAINYLESCDPNAIIFTIGDNDTFPLWYAQEVEGIRTDVRVVCTSLFNVDWYIDQMKRKAYESDPIPSKLTHEKYKWGTRDQVILPKDNIVEQYMQEVNDSLLNNGTEIKNFMAIIASDQESTKYGHILDRIGYPTNRERRNKEMQIDFAPTNKIKIPVNKEVVLKNGIVLKKDANKIVDFIEIEIEEGAIMKNRLMMLDIIAENNWERPIYFSGGSNAAADYIWMQDYLQLDGYAYKLIPIKNDSESKYSFGRVDSEKMYKLVKNWEWGNSGDPNMYHDIETRRNCFTYRLYMLSLIDKLLDEGELKKAEEIADLAMEKMPIEIFGVDSIDEYMIFYYKLKANDKARNLYRNMISRFQENLIYYSKLSASNRYNYRNEYKHDIERYVFMTEMITLYEDESYVKTENEKLVGFYNLFTKNDPLNIDEKLEE